MSEGDAAKNSRNAQTWFNSCLDIFDPAQFQERFQLAFGHLGFVVHDGNIGRYARSMSWVIAPGIESELTRSPHCQVSLCIPFILTLHSLEHAVAFTDVSHSMCNIICHETPYSCQICSRAFTRKLLRC